MESVGYEQSLSHVSCPPSVVLLFCHGSNSRFGSNEAISTQNHTVLCIFPSFYFLFLISKSGPVIFFLWKQIFVIQSLIFTF